MMISIIMNNNPYNNLYKNIETLGGKGTISYILWLEQNKYNWEKLQALIKALFSFHLSLIRLFFSLSLRSDQIALWRFVRVGKAAANAAHRRDADAAAPRCGPPAARRLVVAAVLSAPADAAVALVAGAEGGCAADGGGGSGGEQRRAASGGRGRVAERKESKIRDQRLDHS